MFKRSRRSSSLLQFNARTAIVAAAVLMLATAGARVAFAQATLAVKLVPSAIDLGWNGLAHDTPLLEGGGVLLAARQRCDNLSPCSTNADCATGTCTSSCDLPGGGCELFRSGHAVRAASTVSRSALRTRTAS
jgi:hypothetical protein